jgi:hypothetical protein
VVIEASAVNLGLASLKPDASVAFYLDDPGDPGRLLARMPLDRSPFGGHQMVVTTFIDDGLQHRVYAIATNAEDSVRFAGRYDALGSSRPLPTPGNTRAGASPVGPGVLLNWTGVQDGRVLGYDVYRSDRGTGPFLPIGQTGVAAFLDDSAVAGPIYYYRVASRDERGNSSLLSAVVATTAGGR